MNQDFDQLLRAQKLMAQAMGCASNSLPNNRTVSEARSHMRIAMEKLNEARQTQMRKHGQQHPPETWWDKMKTATGEAPMANVSNEAYARTLDQLNAMISEEKQKLADLEGNVQAKAKNTKLFND